MRKLASLLLLSSIFIGNAQTAKKPKLVVGIVVDQMRYDYLQRFKDKFGSKGFNEIIENGTTFENAHYNYIPTYTAVGHASIYTGTTPKDHGIIGNNWYDKYEKKSIYVVDDENFETVGSTTNEGKKSPKRLIASTVADQLKLTQNFNGKVIGVAVKDRSAILPAGHSADIAYWFDGGKVGNWVTSSYYTKELPNWVSLYNTTNKVQLDEYLASPWMTEKNINDYTESIKDHNHYEGVFKGEEKPIFPHDLATLKEKNGGYSLLKTTPFGNTMTLGFAKEIVKNEELGKNKNYSDFLAISISCTDYIGHKYGAMSKETEDAYIRLNNDIDDFISYLNKKVGKNNYVLFVTADHAVVQIPNYLMDNKIPGGYFSSKKFLEKLNEFTQEKYQSTNLIENYSNEQIFLNHDEIAKLGLNIEEVENSIINEIITYTHIYKAVSAHTVQRSEFTQAPISLLQEGYNQKRSGDILLAFEPAVISDHYIKTGTTHGSGYNYDTHIPILFYGANISKGKTVKKSVNITQIAPTLSNILQIQEANMSSHDILTEVFEQNKE
ncbi:alkaline phosphatase [Wenyingzhuangia fucanilytica]|uniref:Alkaline phosphatase n=1 Tax=Wenyingzhuangia fucanilytica TaxID=1790137 RepID=A0A1B1Y3U9_9FLAO|nr:alkaline phosphatase PafA [Wenyingzhuangia fucanilytica]ANW95441.1 alkaline phosphatase [Wenyingzhuangia fucanilytica]